ncbi:Mini-ribonuclease 3 [Sporolactobacillus sp. Y61]|jgi:ribonuclease-3 family protein|uniref:Mini-ribonuclease 3 n=1 Tax=Sporolactobacillus sp. Y61 TaxID=3160863 RepID=A0AAU8IHC1_9BACL|nr:Mini-ribonuclease 3 [Sporolactobacillus sp. THM19-2]RYL89360.1 ribonuclease III [Sporolactobacillus sp. THM19-2]
MTIKGKTVDPATVNSLVLAFMGDAIMEVYVREHVICAGKTKIHQLHKQTVNYVSARAQCTFLHELQEQHFLTDEEMDVVRRGRNTRSHSVPRNTDVQTYNFSTGFEALIGYLYFSGKGNRIQEIMAKIFTDHPTEGGASDER